jgi:hypothetical protein
VYEVVPAPIDDEATVQVPEAVPVVEYSTWYPVTDPADFVGALQVTFNASGLAVTETELGADTVVGLWYLTITTPEPPEPPS